MVDLLAYADGTLDLLGIAEAIHVPAWTCQSVAATLLEHGLLEVLPGVVAER